MKNEELWKPSKFVYKGKKLIANRDTKFVMVSSRLSADLIARFYQENVKSHCSGSLLDLGCGTAPLYATYKPFVTSVECVDWGNSCHDLSHLDHECDLNKPMPLESEKYDTIIVSDVLAHIRFPEVLWSEMTRLLKPQGKIILTSPFFYWLNEHPHDYYRYTKFSFEGFAETNGLKVISLEPYGGVPEIWTDIMAKLWVRVPGIGNSMAAFTQWFMQGILRTGIGKRVTKSTRDLFPFGYGVVVQKS